MSNGEKGIYCIKNYGMISFVAGGGTSYCPISGSKSCLECEVITSEKAKEEKQVKDEKE